MTHNSRRNVTNIEKQLIALEMELNKFGVWDQSGIVCEDVACESTEKGSLRAEMQAIESDLAKLTDDSAKIRASVMEGVVTIRDDLVDMGRKFVAIQCRFNEICKLVEAGEEILVQCSSHESI